MSVNYPCITHNVCYHFPALVTEQEDCRPVQPSLTSAVSRWRIISRTRVAVPSPTVIRSSSVIFRTSAWAWWIICSFFRWFFTPVWALFFTGHWGYRPPVISPERNILANKHMWHWRFCRTLVTACVTILWHVNRTIRMCNTNLSEYNFCSTKKQDICHIYSNCNSNHTQADPFLRHTHTHTHTHTHIQKKGGGGGGHLTLAVLPHKPQSNYLHCK